MLVCKKCGHENAEDATFCQNCKTFLEWSGERVTERSKAGVRLLVAPTSLEIEPGSVAGYELSVQNTGVIVDSFRLEVPDANWITIEPPVVNLFPGRTAKARIEAKPARDGSVPAGDRVFTVRATSSANPNAVSEEAARVGVLPFTEIAARLTQGSDGSDGATHAIVVDNKSNHPITGTVTTRDLEDALSLEIAVQRFTVDRGESASVGLWVAPREAETRDRHYPFQVKVDVEGCPPVILDGTLERLAAGTDAAMPGNRRLLWAAAGAAALILVGGAAYALFGHTSAASNAPTSQAPSAIGQPSLTQVNSTVSSPSAPSVPLSATPSPTPCPSIPGALLLPNGDKVQPGPGVPSITLQPDTASIGQTIKVVGSGFKPLENLEIDVAFNPVATAVSDGAGNFVTNVRVPAATNPGCQAVSAAEPQVYSGRTSGYEALASLSVGG